MIDSIILSINENRTSTGIQKLIKKLRTTKKMFRVTGFKLKENDKTLLDCRVITTVASSKYLIFYVEKGTSEEASYRSEYPLSEFGAFLLLTTYS